MSLIQEALRRKDDDDSGMPRPPRQIPLIASNPIPPPPPVLTIPRPASAPRKEPRGWGVAVVVVLGLVLVAGGLFIFYAQKLGIPGMGAENQPPPPGLAVEAFPAEGSEAQASSSSLEPATSDTASGPAPTLQEPAPVQPSLPARVERESPEPETRADRFASEMPAQSPVGRENAPRPAPVARAARPTREAPSAPVKQPEQRVQTVPVASVKTDVWPRLSLNGVMASASPGRGSAIINNRVIEVGEKIDGVRLVEVQRTWVQLEFEGETQSLRVGQSTF